MKKIKWDFIFRALIIALGILFVGSWLPGMLRPLTFAGDWIQYFKPAIQAVINGQSPYSVPGFVSPPWLLVLIGPFALLPFPADIIAIITVSVAVYVFALRRLGASWYIVALFMLLPQVWWSILLGNTDFLICLGIAINPLIGLILISTKPQAAIGVAVFWLVETWRKSGWKEVLKICTPTAVLFIISLVIFGFWPARMGWAADVPWNISPWPFMLPIGIVLLSKALKERNKGYSISSSVFFSPYLGLQSLAIPVLGLINSELYFSMAVFGLWLAWILM